MINGSFVFGMDGDDPTVFERTVEWAVAQGIETATFHILTPYPGTALYQRMAAQQRLTIHDWDLYDTRHAVFRPARMSAEQLESGYNWAYREFYRWGSIARGAAAHDDRLSGLRHMAYPPAGRNSNRCGISSSARSKPERCFRYLKRC